MFCSYAHLTFQMSMFGKIFGAGKKQVPPSTQDALQKLRETEDMLLKKQEFLEKKISAEVATAKKHGTANKRMALQALRRKKKFEQQLEQMDGVLNTIQHQKDSLENAAVNAEVLQVLGSSAKALKGAHNNMDVDNVHDLMDEIEEQQQVARELADALSKPAGIGDDLDDDDLMKELEEMEEADLNKQLLNVGPAPADTLVSQLPTAPTDYLPAAPQKHATKKKEDDDLADLEAWATS
jgi:charged multivesicular body protein 4